MHPALIISNHIDRRRRERTDFPAYLLSDRVIAGFAELPVAVRIHIADYNPTGMFAGLQLISSRNGNLAVHVGDGLAADGDIDIQCRATAHRLLLLDVQAAACDALDGDCKEAMRAYGTDTSRRMYFIEYPISAPLEAVFCVAVPPGSEGELVTLLPPTDALSIYHHGAYEDLPAAGQRLLEYAAEHQFSPCGTLRHIYLEGPPQHKDPQKFITQVVLPIEAT